MPLIWDIAVVAVVMLFAVTAARRGFLSTAAHLVGSVVALIVSLLYSRPLAVALYDRLLRHRVTELVAQNLEILGEASIEAFEQGVQAALSQLPSFLTGAVGSSTAQNLDAWYESYIGGNTADLCAALADTVVAPAATALVQVLVFFALFALCMVVVGLVAGLLRGINHIPLIGSLNGLLGGVLGVAQGLLYVFVGGAVVWLLISSANDPLPFLSMDVVERTHLFRRFVFAGPWAGGFLPPI